MDTELRVREVGLRPIVPVVAQPVKETPPVKKLEERKDLLDNFITKMEEIRPTCPIEQIETAWKKLANFVIDLTPPLLPPKETEELKKRR